ncbi:MAG: PhzF family phenazine biosynthesis protein [Rhodoferax sp.]
MRQRPFQQIDVFAAAPYGGNALAVVLDSADLGETQMQRFAAWTQLSETSFLMPPSAAAAAQGADYQVRIFTTAYEMPFAGHPTLGSCFAWLQAGGRPRQADVIVQECPVGLVRIRRQGTQLAFAAPPSTHAELDASARDTLAQALGLAPRHVLSTQRLCNGPTHIALVLDHVDRVHAVQPRSDAVRATLRALGASGVGVVAVHPSEPDAPPALIRRSSREARAFAPTGTATTAATAAHYGTGSAAAAGPGSGPHPGPGPHQAAPPSAAPSPEPDEAVDLEVRFFADDAQLNEDPATGSFNAALAPWLMDSGRMPARYTVAQGRSMGRDARLTLERDAQGQLWVGGQCLPCVSGIVVL